MHYKQRLTSRAYCFSLSGYEAVDLKDIISSWSDGKSLMDLSGVSGVV